MALARGIAYYTGMIFELTGPRLPPGASLGGGGRYDGLVQALGGDDLPALGFAYDMDHVRAALAARSSTKASR
jgi:histidyl-tRNA synthetase